MKINKIETFCLFCKSPIFCYPHQKRKYCNNSCQGKHTKSKSFEKVVAGNGRSILVKEYILETRGYKCEYCGVSEHISKITNNTLVKIPLELEHIDGNADNNKLENCVVICPTCHSLTPTFKNKNKGKGRATRRLRYQEGKSY